MELLQLKYFQKVALLEHMTKAANELHIAQPALSMMIARLEDDLGVPLFDRTGRQIRLNAYGAAFLRKVETALHSLEEGRREINDMAGLERGTVKLAATTLNRYADLLGGFLSEYPHVRFRIIQAPTEEMKVHMLEHDEVDFCFSSLALELPGICCTPLLTEEIMLAVPPAHRLAGQSSVSLKEVAHESFISLKAGYSIRDSTDEYCRAAGFTPNIVCEGEEPASISRLVSAGLGVALVPEAVRRETPSLHLLHIEKPLCEWTLHLAWREKHYLSLAAQTFRDFVFQYFAEQQK